MPREFDVDPAIRALVKHKARRLLKRSGVHSQDRDDLEQELFAYLLERLPNYDPTLGRPEAFAEVVLQHGVEDIYGSPRRSNRAKPGASLASLIPSDDEVVELGATVGQRELDNRRKRWPRSPEEKAQLRHDIETIVPKLDLKLRELATGLMHYSLAELARKLRIPRPTLQDLKKRLRRRLEGYGLSNYL